MASAWTPRQRELFEKAKSSSRVILARSDITHDDALVIAEGLKANGNLQYLELSDNQIGDAGAQAIGSALRNKSTLIALSLNENKISDIGAFAVAEGLQASTALTELGMFINQIGDAGAQAIGSALRNKANLSILHLSNNKIGDIGAFAIAEGLQASTALTQLGMFTNQIGDGGAQAIGSALRNKASLSSLYLDVNRISDIGACAVAEGLQTSTALTQLGMHTNQIGDAGAQAIGAALRNKANLSKLNLSDNQISASAVQLISKSVPAKCEFSAGNQRTRPQNATSPPAIPPKPAHLDHTPNSPLAASDATSQQVLSQATTQFSESKRIGGGGFGSVYSGVWSGQRVAVKRLAADSTQGISQFEAELEALSRFRHPNIVTIMCYAQEGNERCLVYELMPNGSVRDRLDRKGGTPALSWQQRRTIATDIANAMHFVQTAIPRQPLFHLDLKTDNVLLAADFHAKVADFGLTRSAPAQVDAHSYIRTQTVQGTLQYICPQYRDEGKVSIKTDVYSYGMILLELVTGQPPSIDLMGTVRRELKRSRKIDAVLDKAIDWSPQDKESAQAMAADLAPDCLETARIDRPSFGEILRRLSGEEAAGANEEETIEGSDRECLVCYNAPTNAKLMPCHHACVCVACAQWMIERRDKCMICRVLPTSFQQGTYTKTFVQ
ncbi:protein tyrosine kinase [Capsaspora owczarzaki ATCC 30864]|uniref:TKL/IRAK protein kinase n=1 Tax=Capsaspora owczarzaki (strain ATCC 30864) TaxID=595528 RepID=A0A0D2WR09_CAPO3|nr:protein tyrosine kinase [Capsaspora owczarzaki ATCC 30864]KJE94260.1 TKL/IRAK protein kinase [Capsaspora owczarzaki ATCC 30864]|eukprot:XP_004347679.1 protein tyrosine kinase [Capsaspora owczarzaki ATCC 30864]